MDDCCQGKAREIAQLRDKQSRVLKVVLGMLAEPMLATPACRI